MPGRPFGRIGVAWPALGVVPLSLVVLLRALRRRRASLLSHGAFRRLLKTYNVLTRRVSGTRISTVGLLTHVGRRSGRNYQTSVGVTGYGDGFLVPLTYGPGTDWYRNISTAGSGTLAWKGRTFTFEKPEIVSGPQLLRAWPMRSRILLQLAGIDDFVWLHRRP
ncbi:nitroreductase/quinone reductase family protein [Mycobacterium asiaticum]|uniref:nitroreductase/quinone reductase family protein n=1 Tax=Mycobacterium asiaticum TaxID=1790 RepID=UPI0009BE2275|nr:nitroreductase/quinone reductase family protein [Mycobacterium asiaticum]